MIRIEGRDDHTPTRRLSAALHRAHPHLFTATPESGLTLTIAPRSTVRWPGIRCATKRAWYDLYWTRPETVTVEDNLPITVWTRVALAGTLPPPPVLPLAVREAATPPASIDGMDPRRIALLGGREAALRRAENHRALAIRWDRTVDIYDWAALADTAADLIASLAPPAGAR